MIATITKDVTEGQPRSVIVMPDWHSAEGIVAAYFEARINTHIEMANRQQYCGEDDAHMDNATFYRESLDKIAAGDHSPIEMYLGAAVAWALDSAEADGTPILRRLRCPSE